MNLLFGLVSKKDKDFSIVKNKIEELYNANSKIYINENNKVYCGCISNNGLIIGTAKDDNISVIYIGSFYKPVPDWNSGSPLDDPELTASFFLQRYKKLGKSFMDNILGSYVLVLYDKNQDKFFIYTDTGGFRKVYYAIREQTLFFSTTLLPMANLLGKTAALNRPFEDFLLGYEFLPGNQTIIKDVHSISKGKGLCLKKCKIEPVRIEIKPYEPSEKLNSQTITEEELIDSLYQAFLSSIKDLCPTSSPIAVLLGGVDSALIASMLKKLGKEVETFTFGFNNNKYNQSNVEYFCNHYGIKHTWVNITPEVILWGLNNYSKYFNNIASCPHYLIQTAKACLTMREKGYLSCFTGHGCDELFMGYPNVFSRARLFMNIDRIPSSFMAFCYKMLSYQLMEDSFGHPTRFIRNFLKVAQRGMPSRGHISSRIFDEFALNRIRNKRNPHQAIDAETILESLTFGLEHYSPLKLAYHGKAMPGLSKNNLEGSSNLGGINIVSPYSHPILVKFSESIPEEMLRPSRKTKSKVTGKYILMKMVEKYKLLPKEIIYQKKASPLSSPVDSWYSNELKDYVLSALESLPFEYDKKYVKSLLRPKFSEKLFRDHISIGSYTSNAIALLLTYASFAKYLHKK